MTKTAAPGQGRDGGNGSIISETERPNDTPASPVRQCPASPVDLAHAERETLRRVISATARTATPALVADLQSLWRSAEKRLAAARRAIREAGRRRP